MAVLRIIIEANIPTWYAQAVKEDLAMVVERRGDCRVVSIEEIRTKGKYEQMKIGGENRGKQ